MVRRGALPRGAKVPWRAVVLVAVALLGAICVCADKAAGGDPRTGGIPFRVQEGAEGGLPADPRRRDDLPGPVASDPGAGGDELASDTLEEVLGPGAAQLVGEGITTRLSERPLAEEAASVLLGYRDRRDCVLVRAGYLDLMGSVWSCVVEGDRWVEVVVVRERDGQGSSVDIAHMDAREWEQELEGLNDEGR